MPVATTSRVRCASRVALAAGLVWSVPALGEVTPQPGAGDPHIQSVAYDPQEVVGLHVATGYAVTVQFSPDEHVQTVTVGDPDAWQIQVNHAADDLVISSQGTPTPTNLTVITDTRTYNFTLYGGSAGTGVQPYVLTFTYPVPGADKAVADNPPVVGRYKLHGDHALWPEAISDDGTFTAIRWPAKVAMPAVYRDDDESGLALVNGSVKDGAYIVEGVHRQLVFVTGKLRARATRIVKRSEP